MPTTLTVTCWPVETCENRLPGTSAASSRSPWAMRVNSGSARAEAVAPTTAKRLATTPATGALTSTVAPLPSSAVSRTSGCPALTVSPASASTRETCIPSRSGRTSTSSRGTRMPVTSTESLKHARFAFITDTAAPTGLGAGSAAGAAPAMRPTAPAQAAATTIRRTARRRPVKGLAPRWVRRV